ncbi:MAG: type II secretion system protein GspD [Planctomycetota bacterium]|jgi:type II secretory pathway component GspD/PulD (secretin)
MMIRHHHLLLATSISTLALGLGSCSAPSESGTTDSDQQEAEGPGEGGPQDPESLAQERNRFLVQRYLAEADRLEGEGNTEGARMELLKARELDPSNDTVLARLRGMNADLPQAEGAESLAENFQRLKEINAQRHRAEVIGMIDSGNAALDQGNFDRAIDLARQAQLNIDIGESINWGNLEDRVDALEQSAIRARDESEQDQVSEVERQVAEERRTQEAARVARQNARTEDLINKSMRAFQRRQFKLSQDFAFEAMRLDNNNQVARQMHDAAIKAMRQDQSDRYFADKRREIQKMLEAAEELRVPQTDLVFSDLEAWNRAQARSLTTASAGPVDPEDTAMQKLLQDETIAGLSFTEDDGGFDDVKTRIQAITGIPIIITPGAREVIDGEDLTLVMDITAPISIGNFLGIMVAESESLAWTVRNGVVEISTKSEAGGSMATELKDVRDLVMPKTEFIPPTIVDLPSDSIDDSDVPRTGGESDETTFFIEMDNLVEQLKDATDRLYWESDTGANLDSTESGYIIVTAGPALQTQVEGVLNDMRRFSTTVVSIQSKFLTITNNFLQEIGVDWRGLGGNGSKGTVAQLDDITNGLDDNASRGLDNAGTRDPAGSPVSGAFFNDGGDGDIRARTENYFMNPLGSALSTTDGAPAALVYLDDLELQAVIRAIEKQQDIQELNGQELTVLNNQRGHVAVINQTSYVRDFDIEVAQAAFIADPKVDVIQDGIVLDVKPTVNYDRRSITLELHPTVAELIRPIPTFSTSLAGTTQPVTIQLPTLQVRSFATVATVPDGGSVLIGGLREVFTTERRAEVPVLGQIPLVSFFFKQEGVSDENTSLVVLITAAITDVTEIQGSNR